jgi:hypothetical protein
MNVDGAGAQEVTIPPGVYQTSALCKVINGLHASFAGVARDDSFGRIVFMSTTAGTGSSIVFSATSTAGQNVKDTIGYSATASNTGVNSGSTGSVAEGSFIWLANPQNFIMGIVRDTRIHAWFNHNYDRIEIRMYNQLDFQIENVDAVVKAKNVRVKKI